MELLKLTSLPTLIYVDQSKCDYLILIFPCGFQYLFDLFNDDNYAALTSIAPATLHIYLQKCHFPVPKSQFSISLLCYHYIVLQHRALWSICEQTRRELDLKYIQYVHCATSTDIARWNNSTLYTTGIVRDFSVALYRVVYQCDSRVMASLYTYEDNHSITLSQRPFANIINK